LSLYKCVALIEVRFFLSKGYLRYSLDLVDTILTLIEVAINFKELTFITALLIILP
jgi:hypothetical protein